MPAALWIAATCSATACLLVATAGALGWRNSKRRARNTRPRHATTRKASR